MADKRGTLLSRDPPTPPDAPSFPALDTPSLPLLSASTRRYLAEGAMGDDVPKAVTEPPD